MQIKNMNKKQKKRHGYNYIVNCLSTQFLNQMFLKNLKLDNIRENTRLRIKVAYNNVQNVSIFKKFKEIAA